MILFFLGWSNLSDCLNKGGLMKISLYSKIARQEISKIRNEIKSKGINSDPLSIKKFRKILIDSQVESHKKISEYYDFFNLSTLRDLIFSRKGASIYFASN